jgi:predicted nucleotidyltransferase
METSRNQILSVLSQLKPKLYNDYSVIEIGLFGSFANETNDENSDIDILVELEKPIGWKFFTLEIFLENTFNRKIDLVTKSALKEQIKYDILSNVKFV